MENARRAVRVPAVRRRWLAAGQFPQQEPGEMTAVVPEPVVDPATLGTTRFAVKTLSVAVRLS
jgi:hypothetical protein